MVKLRVAVIGAGIGRYGLAPAFLLNPKVEIAAVCTSRQETADAFAKAYNVKKAYGSWEQLLEEDLDAVVIATPPTVQAKISSAAAAKNIPLFLEKQIAANLPESHQLLDAIRQRNILSCVNFIFPELPTWRLMKNYLDAGRLGQIRHIFLNWRLESFDTARKTPDIWKTQDALGGGVLQHFLSHSFHYLEHLFGKIKELRCTLSPAPDLRADGSSSASLDLIFANNLIAHIAASNSAYAGAGHSLEIYGSEGTLLLKNETKDFVLGFKLYHAPRGQEMQKVGAEASHGYLDSRILPIRHLADRFIESIEGADITHPTIDDGHRVQVLLDSAKRSAAKRSFVDAHP
jgi:predicted dehydrogenase